tara:strand:+ start:684 stop:1205 length:522 start_codon:yes stop_codon:yes gene_type:complete
MALSPNELQLISTIAGGLLAIAGGVSSTYFIEKWKNKRLETNLAWAFYGEVNSICQIVRKKEYVANFKECGEDLRNGKEVNRQAVKADNEYFHIFKTNASNIGMLSHSLPVKLVSFYAYGTSALEDISALSTGFHNDKSNEAIAEYFDSIGEMFYQLLSKGDEIVQIIEHRYS